MHLGQSPILLEERQDQLQIHLAKPLNLIQILTADSQTLSLTLFQLSLVQILKLLVLLEILPLVLLDLLPDSQNQFQTLTEAALIQRLSPLLMWM